MWSCYAARNDKETEPKLIKEGGRGASFCFPALLACFLSLQSSLLEWHQARWVGLWVCSDAPVVDGRDCVLGTDGCCRWLCACVSDGGGGVKLSGLEGHGGGLGWWPPYAES